MADWKKIIAIVLSVSCGLLFVFSAYTKLFPIEPLETSLVDIGFGWKPAPYIARTLIGFEFIIGFFFIFLFKLKKVTIPAAVLLLLIFTIYLLLLIRQYGNRGSCGCFGETLPMTPVEGIIKNIFLIVVLLVLYPISSPFEFRFKKTITVSGAIILLTLPFVINPVTPPFNPQALHDFKKFKLNLDVLYAGDSSGIAPAVDLRRGKYVIAFLSLRCPHCKIAAKKLAVIEKGNPHIPMFFIMAGNDSRLKEFFDYTKSDSMPYMHFRNNDAFLRITGGRFPRIYFVNNSVVEYETNYFQLEQQQIETWLAIKDSVQ